jgi:BASS family bile acid:Na+ symporter
MQNSGLGMALSLIHFGKVVALPSAIFSLWHNLSAIFLISFWSKKKKHNYRD